MRASSIIAGKSMDFAVRIVNLYKYLTKEKSEYILSKQLLRSGTSIGANVSEALRAQSTADFIAKLYISLKESGETEYWIKLLEKTDYLTKTQADSILKDCEELIKILVSIIKTTKTNNS